VRRRRGETEEREGVKGQKGRRTGEEGFNGVKNRWDKRAAGAEGDARRGKRGNAQFSKIMRMGVKKGCAAPESPRGEKIRQPAPSAIITNCRFGRVEKKIYVVL